MTATNILPTINASTNPRLEIKKDKFNKTSNMRPVFLKREYQVCITNLFQHFMDSNSIIKCNLSNNLTISIYNILGRGESVVYNVSLDQDINLEYYAMKYAYGLFEEIKLINEYKFLFQFKRYSENSNISLNIPWSHPLLPVFRYSKQNAKSDKWKYRTFIFKQQISSPIQWINLIISNNTKLLNFSMDKLLQFHISGYQDILKIFNEMFQFGVIYQDLSYDNIIINIQSQQFYLFDFNTLCFIDEQKENLIFKENENKISFGLFIGGLLPYLFPPQAWYYLASARKRRKFRDDHMSNITSNVNIIDTLIKYGHYKNQYAITTMMFHSFAKYLIIKYHGNNNDISYMKQLQFLNKNILSLIDVKNRNPKLLDKDEFENLYQNVWCQRFKMVQILREQREGIMFAINDIELVEEFFGIIKIYDNDLNYINETSCSALLLHVTQIK